ncbi:YdbH family protein [Proteus vulgaris]|uniref:YdbH family protein n=1 Tax=Proteus TaxID=583 RepID=UPI000F4D540B|nr:YdbH family protein [Proteus vulgaris]MBI6510037.1 YdbH family protein [Proteus sp. PR00174]NBN46941.1 YdbH family protein [Proteus sp. G2626]AYY80720.1 YdbH family protein [Proteus vulgaris]MBG5983451.1 YdbH family protein [Proteus vulgaris]MCH4254545.1 YdbH family protein [Proteus vulgaris]
MLLRKTIKWTGTILVGVSLIGTALWVSIPRWLPVVAKIYLPEGVTLSLSQPQLQRAGVSVENIALKTASCTLANMDNFAFSYRKEQIDKLQFNSQKLTIDEHCFSTMPPNKQEEAVSVPVEINSLLTSIPYLSVNIENLLLKENARYQGSLQLKTQNDGRLVTFQGENAQLGIFIRDNKWLDIKQFKLNLPDDNNIELAAEIALPIDIASLPEKGTIDATLLTSHYAYPLVLILEWEGLSGTISLAEQGGGHALALLPWHVTPENIKIEQGRWEWFGLDQPLRGGININIAQWQKGLTDLRLSARLNVMTEGHAGKGNLVISIPETAVNWLDAHIPIQITGVVNKELMQASARLPINVTGTFVDPTVEFQSGSLLRFKGPLTETLTIKDARLPLAGTTFSSKGFNGRLNAIVVAQDKIWGDYRIHFQGKATDFLPDNGTWQWRYWGEGNLLPLKARWDIAGTGYWVDKIISFEKINTGFDVLKYQHTTMTAPRLSLESPFRWIRDEKKPAFGGKLKLTSQRIDFPSGGFLDKADFIATISGESPFNFNVKGELSARPNIGPIAINTRWDGARLRGQMRWPLQPINVFQSLIPDKLGITLDKGELYTQADFSIAPEQGLIAGGHLVVKQGGMWLKEGILEGLDFILPWRLNGDEWQLGVKQPVQLRIKRVNNLFEMTDITADLQGFYPATENKPLVLSNVNVAMLDGTISLAKLTIPQHEAAIISLDNIQLSHLFTLLKVTQFAASGKVSGEFPFFINNNQWIIKDGWLANSSYLTLRLDKDFVDSIDDNNMSAGIAMAWLRYLEINRSWTRVNLSNLGELILEAEIQGTNPLEDKRRQVNFNYRHEENVFQLWRSLRFGSQLEEWLEKSLSDLGSESE